MHPPFTLHIPYSPDQAKGGRRGAGEEEKATDGKKEGTVGQKKEEKVARHQNNGGKKDGGINWETEGNDFWFVLKERYLQN